MATARTPRKPKRPTMQQIAARAGVSPTTVAHTLNRTPGAYIAEATRQRVLEAAQALGYQQSLLSRSIKMPLRHLGFVVSEAARPYARADALEIFEGVRQEAMAHRYLAALIPLAPEVSDHYSADKAVASITQHHRTKLFDGFILDKSCILTASVQQLDAQGVPFVTVNGAACIQPDTQTPIPSVIVHSRVGGRLATSHLLELGHRRIALLTRPWSSFAPNYRPYQVSQLIRGYHDAHTDAGVPYDPALQLDADPWNKTPTYQSVARLLALSNPPTAIFAADDAIAVMVIQALGRHGLRVPRDISVVGFGGWSQAARIADPELTTVTTDLRQNGVLAARLLIERLESGKANALHVALEPHLHVGASTAPPPSAPMNVPSMKRSRSL
ncbi:MAG TPA: LacI family DNA-binding transcriptional regulator [Phycisphaeraceae bacterium]